MQSLAMLCVLINVPRTLDLSAVYGRIDYPTATLLHNIVTALQLFCLDVFILSTARALYLQLQKPIPQFYTITLLLSDGLYLLCVVILNAISYRAHNALRTNHPWARDQLNLLWALRGIAFDVTLAIIIAINIVLFARLYRRLSQFIKTVEQQAKNTAITSEPTGSPSLATISRMQTFAKTITAHSKAKQQQQSGSPQASPSHKPRASTAAVPLLPQRSGKSLPPSPILKARNGAKSGSGGGAEEGPKSPQTPSKPPAEGKGALFVRTKSAGQSLQPQRLDMNAADQSPPCNTDGTSPCASSPNAAVGATGATNAGAAPANTAVPPSVTVSVGETGEQNNASGSGELVLRIFPNTPVAGERADGAPEGVDRRISDDSASGPPTPSRPASPIATPSAAAAANASGPPPLTPPRPAAIIPPTTPLAGSSSPQQPQRALGRTTSLGSSPQALVRAITVRGAQIPPSPAGGPPISRATTQMTFGRTQTIAPQTSHETRVKELRKAVRTLSILSGCVFVIGLASIAWDLPDSLASLSGSFASDESLFGPRPDEYGMLHNAFPLIQQINLAIIAWYCWTPWYFRAKYRAQNKIGFWAGLRDGYQEGAGSKVDSKYAAGPEGSKKGPGDSKLLRQATQKSVQRTHTMSMAMQPSQAAAAAALAAAHARKDTKDDAAAASPLPTSPAPTASPLASTVAPAKKAWGSMDVTATITAAAAAKQSAAARHKPLGSTDNDSEDDEE